MHEFSLSAHVWQECPYINVLDNGQLSTSCPVVTFPLTSTLCICIARHKWSSVSVTLAIEKQSTGRTSLETKWWQFILIIWIVLLFGIIAIAYFLGNSLYTRKRIIKHTEHMCSTVYIAYLESVFLQFWFVNMFVPKDSMKWSPTLLPEQWKHWQF